MSKRRGRKIVKMSAKDMKAHDYIMLPCSMGCGNEVKVEVDTVSVICGLCACKKAGPTDIMLKAQARSEGKIGPKKPRGYHLKPVFVDVEGNVFHKGVEQPSLKGTLPVTVIEPKVKLTKFERQKRREERQAKKDAKLAKKYKEVKKEKKIQEKATEFFNGESNGTNEPDTTE